MEIINITDTLPKHATKTWYTRTYVDTMVIHHLGSGAGDNYPILSIANYHVNTRDYPGIAYTYCIDGTGKISQVNDIMSLTWHAGNGTNDPDNANIWGVGVCILGDFTDSTPKDAQLTAASDLAQWLKEHYNVTKIIGHKEAPRVATDCPGNLWLQWKPRIKFEDNIVVPPSTAAIKWSCEEAVREIEATQEKLADARRTS
jgi:N-acetyl-anhydromuramyl-L-alanine amidase AmpD